jgi:predicted RNA-binding Zn ribbon-like protein
MTPDTPVELRLVQDFVNTRDVEQGRDEIASAQGLARWLRQRRLLRDSDVVDAADVIRATELRESLRVLLHRHHGAPVDPDAIAAINSLVADLPVRVAFGADARPELEPALDGARGALGRIVADVMVAMTRGTWQRLKTCSKDTCQWAFYDHSKNRSGRWCSMQVCGNRTKTRAYRARQRSVH